ncbi:hypothetical protein BH18ACI2_BH18ACI2_30590 [soil metagenome]
MESGIAFTPSRSRPPSRPPTHQRSAQAAGSHHRVTCIQIGEQPVKSTRWRDYLFQRHIEIILKEALYQTAKRDPELTAEKIDDPLEQSAT